MLGAIMGDVCGSPWEGGAYRDIDFVLFADGASITDDTVCTIAVAHALLTGTPVSECLRAWCKRYPGLGYGSQFNLWVYRASMGPYGSWGNGGAMRVSACAWLANSLEEAESLAEQTAAVTHNHAEGLRGARAIAGTLWLARQGLSAAQLLQHARIRYGYQLGLSVAERAAMNPAGCEAIDTVPIALDCAIHATSVQDAIHRAVFIGGDTDTTAAMAAAIAEARFGLTPEESARTLNFVPEEMHPVIHEVYARASPVPHRQPGNTARTPGSKPWWQRLWQLLTNKQAA